MPNNWSPQDTASLVLGIIGAVTGILGTVLGLVALIHQVQQSRIRLRATLEAYPSREGQAPNPNAMTIRVTNLSSFRVPVHALGMLTADRIIALDYGANVTFADIHSGSGTTVPHTIDALGSIYIQPRFILIDPRTPGALRMFIQAGDGSRAYLSRQHTRALRKRIGLYQTKIGPSGLQEIPRSVAPA